MTQAALKRWLVIHKWTSLVCTLFLLMTCITGLPLIFHDDIDQLTGHAVELAANAGLQPRPPIDTAIGAAVAANPGNVVQLVVIDRDDPDLARVRLAPEISSGPRASFVQPVDLSTGYSIVAPPREEGFVWTMFRLHTDFYAGLAGTLFLGAMAAAFVVAVVSGIVVYRPFMRKIEFGTVRRRKSARVKWLDLHNLLGITTLAWALVVGATGVVNALSIPMLGAWQAGQLAEMTAPYIGRPAPVGDLVSVDAAIETAVRAAPGMTPFVIAMPGSAFSSDHHYAIYMHGGTSLTSRILKPALVDAKTGALTAIRDMPWYVRALFLSQPLHFGDYGGRTLQVVWALLDLVTIAVLLTGLRLFFRERHSSIEPGAIASGKVEYAAR